MSNGRVRWRCSELCQDKPTREEALKEEESKISSIIEELVMNYGEKNEIRFLGQQSGSGLSG
jgi:hypothetical protein